MSDLGLPVAVQRLDRAVLAGEHDGLDLTGRLVDLQAQLTAGLGVDQQRAQVHPLDVVLGQVLHVVRPVPAGVVGLRRGVGRLGLLTHLRELVGRVGLATELQRTDPSSPDGLQE